MGNKRKRITGKWTTIILGCILLAVLSIFDYIQNREIEPVKEEEEIVLNNVWVTEAGEDSIQIFFDEFYLDLKGDFEEKPQTGVVADIVMKNGELKEIKQKTETIYGRILSFDESGIEIEGYGHIELEEECRIIKTFGTLEELDADEIQVGYEGAEFFVAAGKVCGIIMNQVYVPENIRVLLHTSGYGSLYHESVVVCGSADLVIAYGEEERELAAGEELEIKADSDLFEVAERIYLKAVKDTGEIAIENIERKQGTPSYLGTLEIEKTDEGLMVTNELSLEQYLYSVVPSEMPTSYDLEALKAQAVCARSYAYKQMEEQAYAEYGAHVDDSVMYQVYNDLAKDENSIRAVDETTGIVVRKNEEVVETFYFSTSYGYTSTDAVWSREGEGSSYLIAAMTDEERGELDFSEEDTFIDFIKNGKDNIYEEEEGWYRWNTQLSLSQISASVNQNLETRQKTNPGNILVRNEDGDFEEKAVQSVGDVLKIQVQNRGAGGAVSELLVEGTDAVILIKTEYNIRLLLSPDDLEVEKNDGSKVDTLTLLPSAYFYVEEQKENDALTGFRICGGGYGHGVGMSQNGANHMAAAGMDYEEILCYYFSDVDINSLYE